MSKLSVLRHPKLSVHDLCISAAAGVSVLALIGLLGTEGPLSLVWAAALLLALGAGAFQLRAKYAAEYAARVAKPGQPWDVWHNGLRVGRVLDAQYAAMQREALFDWRNTVAQLLHVGYALLKNSARLFFQVLPVLAFWCVVLAWLFAPDLYALLIAGVTHQDPQAVDGLRALGRLLVTVGLVLWPLLLLCGVPFGLRNYYALAVHQAMRRYFNIPGEGVLDLRQNLEPTLRK